MTDRTVEDYVKELSATYGNYFGKNAKRTAALICYHLGFEPATSGNATRKYMKLTRRSSFGNLWIGKSGAIRSGRTSTDSISVTGMYKKHLEIALRTEESLLTTVGAKVTARWKKISPKRPGDEERSVIVAECVLGENIRKFAYSNSETARTACDRYHWTPADAETKELLLL